MSSSIQGVPTSLEWAKSFPFLLGLFVNVACFPCKHDKLVGTPSLFSFCISEHCLFKGGSIYLFNQALLVMQLKLTTASGAALPTGSLTGKFRPNSFDPVYPAYQSGWFWEGCNSGNLEIQGFHTLPKPKLIPENSHENSRTQCEFSGFPDFQIHRISSYRLKTVTSLSLKNEEKMYWSESS